MAGCHERTFIMVKPDGVQRGLVGETIKRFENRGFKLVGLKVMLPSHELLQKHYAEHASKPFFAGLIEFGCSSPVVAMVWEGWEVIKIGRAMVGATQPLDAHPGTIRGDYGLHTQRNIAHASDSCDAAKREIALWFTDKECFDWKPMAEAWCYEACHK